MLSRIRFFVGPALRAARSARRAPRGAVGDSEECSKFVPDRNETGGKRWVWGGQVARFQKSRFAGFRCAERLRVRRVPTPRGGRKSASLKE